MGQGLRLFLGSLPKNRSEVGHSIQIGIYSTSIETKE